MAVFEKEPARLKKWTVLIVFFTLVGATLVCGEEPKPPEPTLELTLEPTRDTFNWDRTAYGFFPNPPEATLESVLATFDALGEHADVILSQPNVPWEDFLESVDGESQARTDLRNQVTLARRQELDWIFVVDPLNGLNRREFMGLPEAWDASFANPDIRTAFTNFTLWIVREFKPRYLGLASEINTYLDAHPDDVENYMSLYTEVYDQVKLEASETQIFVTFQWDDLRNMFAPAAEGRPAYQTNWGQVEDFEPRLDLWVISSYPYFVFEDGAIPEDYYSPLLERTGKPIAVAEGGWSSEPIGGPGGSDAGQVAYLEALYSQLGERLAFWIYLLLDDPNMESIATTLEAMGRPREDIETLRMFASVGLRRSDGTPKPALTLWDQYRHLLP
jgi:hypothetical protein